MADEILRQKKGAWIYIWDNDNKRNKKIAYKIY